MLRRRIPLSVRREWRLLVVVLLFLGVVGAAVLGSARIRPYVLADTGEADDVVTQDIAGTVDIFDTRVSHTIKMVFKDDEYQRMLSEFNAQGAKDWMKADLTIDGTLVPEVGIRLKGNSTLRALRRGGGGGMGGAMSTSAPETLPWLISFDHFVDSRLYQGRDELAVRPAGRTATGLNEALSLTLVGLAGEPTQRFVYSQFAVNDRPAIPRLIVEHPDDDYARALGKGVLYKALSSGQFTYRGEDPLSYTSDFDQINRNGSQDLQPVIDLIRWVEQATDAEFQAGLPSRVDVESFARYAALQNLLLNFDDMAGPGKNYFLWYDLDLKRFKVITWDLNLALMGNANQGPFDVIRMGGGPGAGAVQPRGGGPVVVQPPAGGGPGVGGPAGGGGFRAGNRLKERFLALFRQEYVDAYRDVYERLFASGEALRALDRVSAMRRAVGSTDKAAIDSDANTLRTTIRDRTAALADQLD